MKKFTKLWQLMIVLLLSSTVVFAQESMEQIKMFGKDAKMIKAKQKDAVLQNLFDVQKPYAVENEQTPLQVKQAKAQAQATSEKDPNWKATTPPASEFLYDFQFEWPLTNPDGLSVGLETDGNYVYNCHWQNGNYYRYDMNGNYIGVFTITGTSLIRDMAYNPNTGYFYGAAANTTVWEMDFTMGSEALVSTIVAPTACRAIGCDDDNNYLFGNNWSTNVVIFNLSGVTQSSFAVGPFGASYYGFAYDNHTIGGPYIWGYAQNTGSLEWLVQMTYPGGVETGKTFDVGTYLGHVGTIAGGLAITPAGTFPSVAPGVWSLFGITQNTSMWAFELGEPNPCSTPINVDAIASATELEVSWTETGSSTSWEVEYGPAGFTLGNGTLISPATNPQTISGLTTGAAYDVYVRSDCGGGSYSGWAMGTFVPADCEWYVIGYDSYGDGWNGGSLDFYLDGTWVGNWAGPATTGPETYYFPMYDGASLDLVWNVGTWDSEVTYEVYDIDNILVFSDGPNPVGTTGITGYCTPNPCAQPSDLYVDNLNGTQADLYWSDAAATNLYDIVWGETGFDPDLGPFTGTAYGESYPGAPYMYTLTGLTQGVNYEAYVRADCGGGSYSFWAGIGFFSYPQPPNDDCVDAEYVGGPYPQTVNGTTLGATVDCPGILDWNAVWYEVNLPYAMNQLFADYCGTGDQSTIGIVYYPDCSDCGAYVIADSYSFYDCGTPGGVTVGQMQWNLVPGPTTVFFPAYMLPAMDFVLTFDVIEVAIPDNDDCGMATAIGEVTDLPWNTTLATPDTYGTCMTSNNVWYNYTATMDGDLHVSLCGSSFDTKLAIYDSFDCGTMVELGCNDDYCGLQSQIDFGPVTAGTELKIEVGGFSTNAGQGILNVWVVPPLYDVTGTITYDNAAMTPMDAVTVELTDGVDIWSTDMTDPTGYFMLMGPDGTHMLNFATSKAWGGVSAADAVLAKRFSAGVISLTPVRQMAADVNASGGVSTADAILIKRRAAGIISTWAAPDFIFYPMDVTISGAPVVQDIQALASGDVNGSFTPEMQIPSNDPCNNPEIVAGPYPVTGITGTTEFATMDCPSYLNMASGEVWYAIDLPYALNTIVIDIYGDALLDNGWVVGTDVMCSCISTDYYTAVSWNFAPPSVTDLTWESVPGPGTFYYPMATGTFQEGFTLDIDVQEYVVTSYCAASTNTQDEFIGTVTCGTINNPNNVWQGGIGDYTAMSTSIAAGASEPIQVLNGGNLYTGDQVSCWVDWNNDFVFAQGGNEEFVLVNTLGTGAQFDGSITVPVGTPAGMYRMRVRMVWNTAPFPCGVSSYGEVEEYTITVP